MGIFIIHYNSLTDTDQIVGAAKTLRKAIQKAITFNRLHYDDRTIPSDPSEEEIDKVLTRGQRWSSSKMHTKGYIIGSYIVYEIDLFD